LSRVGRRASRHSGRRTEADQRERGARPGHGAPVDQRDGQRGELVAGGRQPVHGRGQRGVQLPPPGRRAAQPGQPLGEAGQRQRADAQLGKHRARRAGHRVGEQAGHDVGQYRGELGGGGRQLEQHAVLRPQVRAPRGRQPGRLGERAADRRPQRRVQLGPGEPGCRRERDPVGRRQGEHQVAVAEGGLGQHGVSGRPGPDPPPGGLHRQVGQQPGGQREPLVARGRRVQHVLDQRPGAP